MSDRPTWTADARVLHPGSAAGACLVLDEPLSLWGGLDQGTGLIVEPRHPQRGATVTGRVLVMSRGRGSSSSSSVLAEALRAGRGPAAIVLGEPDLIVVLGAIVAQLLDGLACPVALVGPADFARLRTGDWVSVDDAGRLAVQPGVGATSSP